MNHRVHDSPNLIYSPGTQVVALKQVRGPGGRTAHPVGAVGVVIRSPQDRTHSYRVRFVDGVEAALHHDQLQQLAEYKQGAINDSAQTLTAHGLFERVIYRCVVGSRAFGLDHDESDTDRRGVYLPQADAHWSLYGVPEQIENDATQEAYWELQKFLVMALKGNPNILECLYTPIFEVATPLAEELLAMRGVFLSKLVFQTYNGYVMSQFKRMQADVRNHGQVKWKHVMHLIRLLLSGIHVLRDRSVAVHVGGDRDCLLEIKGGAMPWEAIEAWRLALHREFEQAYAETTLPERPDYEAASRFLIHARRAALVEGLP